MTTFWDKVKAGKVAARARGEEDRGRLTRPKRAHKKRHSTNKERSRADATQSAKAAASRKAVAARHTKHLDVVRRYYAGEIADLSELDRV